jgi:transcriptional regulator with XRE-family HTH domain
MKIVRALRNLQDPPMSQRRLGELTGMDQSKVSRIEKGVQRPTLVEAELIAEALDVEATMLLSRLEQSA